MVHSNTFSATHVKCRSTVRRSCSFFKRHSSLSQATRVLDTAPFRKITDEPQTEGPGPLPTIGCKTGKSFTKPTGRQVAPSTLCGHSSRAFLRMCFVSHGGNAPHPPQLQGTHRLQALVATDTKSSTARACSVAALAHTAASPPKGLNMSLPAQWIDHP